MKYRIRIWDYEFDGKEGHMFYPEGVSISQLTLDIAECKDGESWLCDTKHEMLLCTEFKDKNKKYIFEGDLVRTMDASEAWLLDNHSIYPVEYDSGAFYVGDELLIDLDFKDLEIVGNIYENKELI